VKLLADMSIEDNDGPKKKSDELEIFITGNGFNYDQAKIILSQHITSTTDGKSIMYRVDKKVDPGT